MSKSSTFKSLLSDELLTGKDFFCMDHCMQQIMQIANAATHETSTISLRTIDGPRIKISLIRDLHLQLEPSTPGGFVKVGGSVQLRPPPPLPHREPPPPTSDPLSTGPSDPSTQLMEALRWDEEGLPFSAILEEKIEETGELRIDAEVKDSGMMLMNAVSPQLEWIQGTANIVLAVSALLFRTLD
jgi:hypothetical protein